MTWTGDAGGSVDVTAHYKKGGSSYDALVGHWAGTGLGVCNKMGKYGCKEKHTVDGAFKRDDYLKFSLGYDATITRITFSDYGKNKFVLSADGAKSHEKYGKYTKAWMGDVYAGSMFFIGAKHKKSSFKVKSITVDYKMNVVPVPAAGFLLLAGLGGFAALKRRKTA
ncbi:MAG: VPLPA-CTERM sorting domain-containing protein [Silicimonas sp.]|nr:VPLPA-CTERM sorting domain-containing protein [Silicimonas sp.]